jgi:hypothetical protein
MAADANRVVSARMCRVSSIGATRLEASSALWAAWLTGVAASHLPRGTKVVIVKAHPWLTVASRES